MAADLIKQYGEENSDVKSAGEAEILAYLQAHYASGDADNAAGLVSDLGGIIASTAATIAQVAMVKGTSKPLSFSVKVVLKGVGTKFVPISFALDAADPGMTWEKAAAKNIGGAIAGLVFEGLAGAALGGLTIAGSGVIATVVGVVGTVAVGYFAAEFVNDAIGVSWDHFVGPKVEGSWNEDDNSATFKVFGRLSDTLRNDWNGIDALDPDKKNINLKLDELSGGWTMTSADPAQQSVEIIFNRAANTFTFSNIGSIDSLWGMYYTYGDDLTLVESSFNALRNYGTTEGSAIVEEILRHHEGDFNVSFGISGSHLVYNYYHRTLSEIQQSVLSGDKAALHAVSLLRSFAEDGNYPVVTEDFSDQYLVDRSAFLFHKLNAGEESNTGEDIDYKDLGLLQDAYAGNGQIDLPGNAKYLFGSDSADLLSGSSLISRSDHLYGMGGNDTLKGKAGADHLEGGKGQDTMYGGTGQDTFYIQGEDESYDIFNGGGDKDKILGSDNSNIKDVIRVHNFEGENRVELIDGRGGENIIAGTDQGDVIDLSGTELKSINRIEGGGGADTITGSAGDDVLYGGSQENVEDNVGDRLLGGAGDDTYYIGDYDRINDSDNQGTIWYKGRQITAMSLTRQSENGNYYANADGSWSALLHEDGSLSVTEGGSRSTSFVIENFDTNSSSYGISFEEYSAPDSDVIFSGSSATTYGRLQFGNDGSGDRYFYDFKRTLADGTSFREKRDLSINDIPSLDVSGSAGRDFLFGLTGSDVIYGGGGDDTIYGWEISFGNDFPATFDMAGDELYGGSGNDYILGAMGADILDGGEGDDIISGKKGDDIIFGGKGKDTILGGGGDDIMQGGSGDDYMSGDGWSVLNLNGEYYEYAWLQPDDGWSVFSSLEFYYSDVGFATGVMTAAAELRYNIDDQGADYLAGGEGNDYIKGMGGDDILLGEADHDTLVGGAGKDTLFGGSGNDWLLGGDGADILHGGTGNDVLYGENADQSGTGADILYGGAGDDQLVGGSGGDILYGDAGNDTLLGDNVDSSGSGSDTLYGGAGNDLLQAAGGNDILNGDAGDDTLKGEAGNDILSGGAGSDYLFGGSENDIYIFNAGDGIDVIEDSEGSSVTTHPYQYRFGQKRPFGWQPADYTLY